MGESHFPEEIRNWEHPSWYGTTQFEEKSRRCSWRIRRVSTSTTSRLISGCRWSNEWLVVHVRKLHIPLSRWTPSQTLLAERGIIPYSTEIHWRLQNYSYEFGSQARASHRWLVEYRWVKRFVWLLDRFHSLYSIWRETSRRIYVVREETDKKAANIQDRLFMSRTLDEIWKESQAEGEAKVVTWKTSTRQCKNITRNSFYWPWGQGIQGDHQECSQDIGNTSGSGMPCKISKNNQNLVTRGGSNKIKFKQACILEATESTRLRMGESLPKFLEDHIAGKRDNSLQRYNLVHKLIPLLQAIKIPEAKAAVDKKRDNLEKILAWNVTKVRSKIEVIEEARASGATVHFASLMDIWHLKNAWIGGKAPKIQRSSCTPRWYVKDPEQGSSASQMTAAKVMDIISRLPGCAGQAASAGSAYTQVKMEDAPKLLNISKSECPDIWIFPPRHKWPKSWSSMEDPVVPLERNLYGHLLAGL